MANPKKRKTKSGILKFITAWLSKEQDKGSSLQTSTNKFCNFKQDKKDFEELERKNRERIEKMANG